MSFDKRLGKDRRKPYHDSRRNDCSCRNHGTCPYCRDNRKFFDKKRRFVADEKIRDSSAVEDSLIVHKHKGEPKIIITVEESDQDGCGNIDC